MEVHTETLWILTDNFRDLLQDRPFSYQNEALRSCLMQGLATYGPQTGSSLQSYLICPVALAVGAAETCLCHWREEHELQAIFQCYYGEKRQQ